MEALELIKVSNQNFLKRKKYMKKHTVIYLFLYLSLFLSSCNKAGTIHQVNDGNDEEIEIYKYYYEYGSYVYITRFKNCPNVITTTWKELQGNYVTTKGNVLIMENDSINVKKK